MTDLYHKTGGGLVILSTVIGALSALVLVSDDCATLTEPFTFRAKYTEDVVIISWKRTNARGEMTLKKLNQTACEILPSKDYNLARYTFQCNNSLHEYTMTINHVEEDEIDSNWTVIIWISEDFFVSDHLQIKLCATDKTLTTSEIQHHELSFAQKLLLFGLAIITCCFAALLIYCAKVKARSRGRVQAEDNSDTSEINSGFTYELQDRNGNSGNIGASQNRVSPTEIYTANRKKRKNNRMQKRYPNRT